MKYMILIYESEAENAKLTEEQGQQIMEDYFAYTAAMQQAGVMLAGAPLDPVATACTVRVRNGKTLTTDGPFAETKEQLGGYYLLEVAKREDALAWAAKCPSARNGSIEVRPLMNIPGM